LDHLGLFHHAELDATCNELEQTMSLDFPGIMLSPSVGSVWGEGSIYGAVEDVRCKQLMQY